jgi:hypothetical protein
MSVGKILLPEGHVLKNEGEKECYGRCLQMM